MKWPEEDESGTFFIACTCRKWSFEGSAKAIRKASREHDDNPWKNHMVYLVGKTKEETPKDREE